jgi:hypothetical protein
MIAETAVVGEGTHLQRGWWVGRGAHREGLLIHAAAVLGLAYGDCATGMIIGRAPCWARCLLLQAPPRACRDSGTSWRAAAGGGGIGRGESAQAATIRPGVSVDTIIGSRSSSWHMQCTSATVGHGKTCLLPHKCIAGNPLEDEVSFGTVWR